LSRRRRIALSYLTNVDGLTGRGEIKTKAPYRRVKFKAPPQLLFDLKFKKKSF
jgi:hypothetical protein